MRWQIVFDKRNTALSSIIGNTYGGSGELFAVPDLRARVPVGFGAASNLAPVTLGQTGGAQTITLLAANLPTHHHTVAPPASSTAGDVDTAIGSVPAVAPATTTTGPHATTLVSSSYAATPTIGQTMQPFSTSDTGGSQPFAIQPPFVGLNYIIAMQGIYPSQG